MRTLRRKHDRNHLYIVADGKCQICGEELDPEDWHADHMIPYWICEETELNNMQALCKTCNLKKGNKMLRKHQREVLELAKKYAEEYLTTGEITKKDVEVANIIAQVFPGGGKSIHPVLLFSVLKEAGIVDKLCWLVPRLSLKNQGATEFINPYLRSIFPHNLEIRETENVNDVDPSRGTDGYITTYQALVSARGNNKNRDNCHQHEFKKHRYLLFMDECQHIVKDKHDAEGWSYYKAVKPLFDLAAFTMGSSGTLFRHEKNEKVAFVKYNPVLDELDNTVYEPECDIIYDYNDAYNEKAIIPIYFNKGQASSVKYTKCGKEYNKAQIENNTDLSVALDTEYGRELLEEGVQIWQNYKQKTNPRSKLIIIGYNQSHCKKISTFLFKKGLHCSLAISDEGKDAQTSIKHFREKPNSNILVTCQMAYEGLDCKQATHLIVLTKIRSLPWLIQMFTRVMRYDKDNPLKWEHQQSFATIPNDPAMEEALQYIKARPNHSIIEEKYDILDDIQSMANIEAGEIPIIENKSSKLGGMSQSNVDGEELSQDLLAKIKLYQAKWNLNQPEIDTYRMLQEDGRLSALDKFSSSNDITPEPTILTIREKEIMVRKDIETIARTLDYKFGCSYGTWNKKTFNAFRRKRRKDMTFEELKKVRQWMLKEAQREAKRLKQANQ